MKISMKYFLALLFSLPVMAVDEEMLLQRKATLLLKRSQVKNIHLFGMDPKNCMPTQDQKILVTQLNLISNNSLSHCENKIADKLRPFDEELKNVAEGVLTFKDVAAVIPLEMSSSSDDEPKENVVEERAFEEFEQPLAKENTAPLSSEEEKVLSTYESNKNEYEANEDDGLFKIMSKAYVRNLNKIWEKKKTDE